jgi:hypothetical protein
MTAPCPSRSTADVPVTADPWRPGERSRILGRLLALSPHDIAAADRGAAPPLLARLVAARAAEMRRLAAGHWSGSSLRAAALAEAIAAETATETARTTGTAGTAAPAGTATPDVARPGSITRPPPEGSAAAARPDARPPRVSAQWTPDRDA